MMRWTDAVYIAVVDWFQRFSLPQGLMQFGLAVDGNRWARMAWGLAAIVVLVVADAASIVSICHNSLLSCPFCPV